MSKSYDTAIAGSRSYKIILSQIFKTKTMYYKEEIINGVLCYKLSPNDEWRQVPIENLSERVKDAEQKVYKLTQLIKLMNEVID